MAIFKRKKKEPPTQVLVRTYGAYIWHQEDVLRILLVGNDPLKTPEHEEFDRDHFRELVTELNRLVDPAVKPYEGYTRVYPNYVAISLIRQRVPGEPVADKVCEILARELGWSHMPILGNVHNFAGYNILNEMHEGRWRLGNT